MVAARDLPYLVRLYDDESPTVHRAVVEALRELGPEVAGLIRSLPEPLDEERVVEILDLVGALESPPPQADQGRFQPGHLVSHRAYGYRGVIVDRDPSCQASEEWYRANRTQPKRGQPWYHVLVDGTESVTYVAQSNLEPDQDPSPVEHPLVAYFFDGFADGEHRRNERPWPSPEVE